MQIKEEIKTTGYFWLPSTPDRQVPGTLTIREGGEIELEIMGLIKDMTIGNHCDLPRIVGFIERYGLITLDSCQYVKGNNYNYQLYRLLFYCHKALFGVAYDNNEDILLNTFQFSVEGLNEWVNVSGIKVDDQWDNQTATITYEKPNEIELYLSNDIKLLITFSWNQPTVSITEAKITQNTYLKLVSEKERSLEDFMGIAYKINTFLCFAMDQIVSIKEISVTANTIQEDMGHGQSITKRIHLYFKSNLYLQNPPKVYRIRVLFRYSEITNKLEKIVNNWIDSYDELKPAFDLYFSTKTGSYKYLQGQFLALVQGLETYHRRISDEKLMNENDYKQLSETLINNCPETHKKWLEGKLKYGNEISLRKRIEYLIEPFKENLGTSKERKKLISTIVDLRNYLTHYDNSLESKVPDVDRLYSLCLKLEAIFQLNFLQLLEFTPEEIKRIIHNSSELKQKLGLNLN